MIPVVCNPRACRYFPIAVNEPVIVNFSHCPDSWGQMRAFVHRTLSERVNWGREGAKLLGIFGRLPAAGHIGLRKPFGVKRRKG